MASGGSGSISPSSLVGTRKSRGSLCGPLLVTDSDGVSLIRPGGHSARDPRSTGVRCAAGLAPPRRTGLDVGLVCAGKAGKGSFLGTKAKGLGDSRGWNQGPGTFGVSGRRRPAHGGCVGPAQGVNLALDSRDPNPFSLPNFSLGTQLGDEVAGSPRDSSVREKVSLTTTSTRRAIRPGQ